MAKKTYTQTFDGGLQFNIPTWRTPMNAVTDCRNFLFERGEIKSRPPTATGASVLGAGTYVDSIIPMYPPIAGGSPMVFGTYKTSASDSTLRMFRFDPLVAPSAAAVPIFPPTEPIQTVPAGLTGGFYCRAAQFDNKTYVHGIYDAGGNPILLEIDNLSLAQTQITLPSVAATSITRFRPYLICEHLSRLFIAEPGTPGVSSYPTVYWCKIGDPTVWTGHFTAGNARLQEASDGIRGMGVMQNMIVIARPTGFHVGVPTGNGSNPYDWKCITRNGPGCIYPESFVIWGDLCFFCGSSDVYMFDMKSITSIGEGISNLLFQCATWFNMTIRAFITESDSWHRNPMLHLIPTYSPSTYNNGGALGTIATVDMTVIPHCVYDLVEKKWSTHYYDAAASDDYPLEGNMLLWTAIHNGASSTGAKASWQRPMLVRRPTGGPAAYMMWDRFGDNRTGCESELSFRTGQIVPFEDTTSEYKLCRVMLVYRVAEDAVAGTMTVDYQQGSGTSGIDFPQVVKTFDLGASGPYRRLWINCVIVGNFFQFTFSFPATEIRIREVVFEFEAEPQTVRTEGV